MLKSRGRTRRPWLALAATPLAFALLGADAEPDAAAPKSDAATTGAEATSTYWQVTQTSDQRPALPEAKLCVGGSLPSEMVDLAKAIKASDIQTCTHGETTAADGTRTFEMSCTMKLSDTVTMYSHMTSWGGAHDRHMRTETRSEGFGPQIDKPHFTEMRMVHIGQCPPNVKPGQYLTPEGEIYDPLKSLSHPDSEADRAADKARLAAIVPPPIVVTPESRRVVRGGLEIACGPSRKWGRLELTDQTYPFGGPKQRWRARPEIGVSVRGEHLLIWHVDAADLPVEEFDTEPTFTVRLGRDYLFTPPIAQHASVRVHGVSPMSAVARARDAAREAADARDETSCFLDICFTSDGEGERFFAAFDRVAARGGDLTISGTDADGPVTVRYPLKGLGGIINRLAACTGPAT